MAAASTIEFAEVDARSSSPQAAAIAIAPSGTGVAPNSRMDAAVELPATDASLSFGVELERRYAVARVEELEQGAEGGVFALVCGAFAAVAGVTFLRGLGIELEALATVLLVMGLLGIVASSRAPLDR